ncbi:hypothetical protein DL98DRAFT_311712 [Cadophora sp. DSE1049]|nr:hypothetical protein DL98DRAFT_311712 [Cadophora sp. DSE1049]
MSQMGWMCLSGDVGPSLQLCVLLFLTLSANPETSQGARSPPPNSSHLPSQSPNSLNCPNCISQFSLSPVNALQCQWPVPMPELSGPLSLPPVQSSQHTYSAVASIASCPMPACSTIGQCRPLRLSIPSIFFSYIPIPCPALLCSITRCWLFARPFQTSLSTAQPPSNKEDSIRESIQPTSKSQHQQAYAN